MLDQDTIREATRLTHAGQLAEATALLQRMLGGKRTPDAIWRTAGRIPLTGREPLTIDAKVNDVEETDSAHLARAPSAPPRGLRPLLDRAKDGSWLGMRGVKRTPPSTSEIAPDGTNFIEAAYSNPAGSRAYKLFVPSGYQGQPIPLVVMLHGCTQSPDDFAAGTRMNFIAEEQTCFVVYPAQRSDANQSKCWNWFRAGDQQRGGGEPSLIAGITRQVMRDYSVDPKRVYVAGLSAGGAAAAIMGATYSDLYAAVGIHSGLACGAATDMPSAFAAMRQGGGSGRRGISGNGPSVPAVIFHGDRDTTVHPNNGGQVLEQAIGTTSTQKTVHRGQIPGGHEYTRTTHTDAGGREILEYWNIHGAAHAWSGGSPAGSYTDPRGPDATREILRFFLGHSLP
ncbi:PHB depolymerase family esterase [Bradyrhizobium sp. AUGA SZCCT0177]|uniref:extracellular catalytic domain type 1 short-chain-length polyhydroxyalkanoate depolymerase n=1 Tax=unclassified Bradyrhizobium TaxID=2631580 RepID=UPI001BAA27F8|nr:MULTISPECIES: PHB depolymerase family esterase [unclassified Bradyrhizobium]MBR1236418.1 PHB depolymerase family esterase [Bradyrhizobium sp. AUGA SZCCT0182]MBR1287335.1 PHB depolymerase family esterase [Bradyrhizobium sp. AUGA SZCCT0177]